MAEPAQAAASDARVWPCRSCGMSLRDCTEEPDPLGVCCAVCGQAARGNHGEYEWQPADERPVMGLTCPHGSDKSHGGLGKALCDAGIEGAKYLRDKQAKASEARDGAQAKALGGGS